MEEPKPFTMSYWRYITLSLCPGLSVRTISPPPPPPPPDDVRPYVANPYPFHVPGSPNLMRSHELQVSALHCNSHSVVSYTVVLSYHVPG